MRLWHLLFVGLFLLIGVSLAGAAEQVRYEDLVAQLKSGDTSIDFKALRYARAELADHDPYGASTNVAKRDMLNALRMNDLDKASAAATLIIERDYTDSDAHSVLGIVHERRGVPGQAAFERAVAGGLYRSIIESGDGMTPETAFVVIAVAEEYMVLRERGLRPAGQALLHTARGPVDALQAIDPANNMRQTLYFDVNRIFIAVTRRLGSQTPKAP